MIDKAGRVDISFNAVGITQTKIQGVPLVELAVEQFSLPIATYTTSYFLTARSGRPADGHESIGGDHDRHFHPLADGHPLDGRPWFGACSAVEQITRNLSAELAPQGIRVVGLRPQGMPETGTIKEVFGLHAKAWGITWKQFHELLASKTHARRLTTLAEMADVAAFMASDQASGMTGNCRQLEYGEPRRLAALHLLFIAGSASRFE